HFQGADRLEVDAQGNLVLHTAGGAIRQRRPVIYQEVGGRRVGIPGGYVLKDGQQVGFGVAAYDRGRPLVIDPVLFYSTYLGGSGGGGTREPSAIIYQSVGGSPTDFPGSSGPYHAPFVGGTSAAYETKLNPAGSAPLVYSTYLGGSGLDEGFGIAVDTHGNAY